MTAIFSFWSLMNAASAREDLRIVRSVPAIVSGYRLAWADFRSSDGRDLKRFTKLDGSVVPEYAFATMIHDPEGRIAGVVYQLEDDDMTQVDQRERGCSRVLLSPDQIEWLGASCDAPVFAYVVDHPNLKGAPVCAGYVQMGLDAARSVGGEFFSRWSAVTPWPPGLFQGNFFEVNGTDVRTMDWDRGVSRTVFSLPMPILTLPPRSHSTKTTNWLDDFRFLAGHQEAATKMQGHPDPWVSGLARAILAGPLRDLAK